MTTAEMAAQNDAGFFVIKFLSPNVQNSGTRDQMT
jgi:hypothetical protein